VKALALTILLTLAGLAAAQQWAGGVQYRFGEDLTANVTIEWPAFDLFGFRAGPSVSLQGHVGPSGFGAAALAGVTIAFVTDHPDVTAWMLDLHYRAVWRSGESARYAPGIGVYATGSF
jgi:hypothetical protein